ncbi:fatty acid desaturase-domain-containing protein [Amylocystis lapponica]|nr:fatty acid desaturase-domain-containing protein [Amylocystis lapponica]
MLSSPDKHTPAVSQIWWTNATFFLLFHAAAAVGVFCYPWYSVPRATLVLAVVLWQAASLGITVGYHRLYSHRAFRAGYGVRLVLALLGASAFQGSIKWWWVCLRHRLHHRFTDDPQHDPYAATRGLLWSHVGWIFFKPRYERLELIDRDDLENDPIVRMQHKYYVSFALSLGIALPPVIGTIWADPIGAFIWGSLVARLFIWHCTFLINSLAHWDGLQPYSDENTSKSNLILALLTCGEGNHNFQHAFPHDYRSGPSMFDWDPSKWVIFLLHALGLVSGLKRARNEDVYSAHAYMLQKERSSVPSEVVMEEEGPWKGPTWTPDQVRTYVQAGGRGGRCVVVLDGFVVDITAYLAEHPGGATLLRKYSVRLSGEAQAIGEEHWQLADWAFHGGLNKHSRAASRRMRELRIARLLKPDQAE